MSLQAAEQIARAVLYEGYLLYPYTQDSTKNRQRWTFGGLYPPAYVRSHPGADACELRSELLLEARAGSRITVRVRFLQLTREEPELWERATERELVISELDPWLLRDSADRREYHLGPLRLGVEVGTEYVSDPGIFRLRIHVRNNTVHRPESRSEALLHSPVSTHLLISISEGRFYSLIDPPESWRDAAARCRNEGSWPVLVGSPGDADLVLSAPIILYDHPKIAPESPGDLFDGGEIDEVLSLRILTLTDEEKARIRASDERGRRMLERTEGLSEGQLARMHGAWRDPEGRPRSVRIGGGEVARGSRVRIRPRRISDAFDLVLDGMSATVQKVEQDLEGQYHVSVSIDEDPGRDLELKAQLGHRFFFKPEDLEPI